MNYSFLFASVVLLLSLGGCAFLEASGEAVGVLGKAGWEAGKAVTSVVYTGSSMAGQTAGQANKTWARSDAPREERTKILMPGESIAVPLIAEGKSYYVRVKLNDKVWGKFLVDTGASAMQISGAMARKLRVKIEKGRTIPVALAGGALVPGRIVNLKSVRIGDAEVENVKAIVLENDNNALRDGLLGMSFLENFVFSIDPRNEELRLQKRLD